MTELLTVRTFDVVSGSGARSEREAELRNRLMIIKGSLRSLVRENVSAADVRESAEDIDRQVARLDRIVSDVLDFARPLHVELAPVDVAALIWDAAGAILDRGEEPCVRLALEPDVGTIVTDGERLRDVLAN